MTLSNPTAIISNPTITEPITRTMSPGETVAVLLTGACVLGQKAALLKCSGMQMEPYPGAETMADVVNACLGLMEQYGCIEDGGATEDAWDFLLWQRLEQVPEGQECAAYCRQYFQDWQAFEDEAETTAKYSAPNIHA